MYVKFIFLSINDDDLSNSCACIQFLGEHCCSNGFIQGSETTSKNC